MAIPPAVPVSQGDIRSMRVKWLAIANGETGAPVLMTEHRDRSVQVLGTFGLAGSVQIEGSNDGGTTWAILTDPQGNALTFTAAKIEAITEFVHMIRPKCTAGDGTTALQVWMMFGGSR